MTSATAPQHQIVDANGQYPAIADGQIDMPGPITCLHCDTDQAGLIRDLHDHGHTVTVVDDRVVVRVAGQS